MYRIFQLQHPENGIRILRQLGRRLTVTDGDRYGSEVLLEIELPTEDAAIERFLAEIRALRVAGFVPESPEPHIDSLLRQPDAPFQDWSQLPADISPETARNLASNWDWAGFDPLTDTVPLRNWLTQLEDRHGLLPLHHDISAEIVRRWGRLLHRHGHRWEVESGSRSACGRYTAFISPGHTAHEGSVELSIWENASQRPVRYIASHGRCREHSVYLSADAEMIAYSADFNCIEAEATFAELAFAGSFNVTDGWTKPPHAIWSPDGNALLLCMYEAVLIDFAAAAQETWFTVDIAATKAQAAAAHAQDDEDEDDDEDEEDVEDEDVEDEDEEDEDEEDEDDEDEDDEDEDDEDEDEEDEFPDKENWVFKAVTKEEIKALWADDEDYESIISEMDPWDHRWEELPAEVRARFERTSPLPIIKDLPIVPKPANWPTTKAYKPAPSSPLKSGKDDLNENWTPLPAFPENKTGDRWTIALPNGLVCSMRDRATLDADLNFSIAHRFAWPLRWADGRCLQVVPTLAEMAAHPWLLESGILRMHLEPWAQENGFRLAD